jgi:hypothetical protein
MGRSVEITAKQWKLYENVPPNEKSKWIFFNQISLSIVDRPSGSRVSHIAVVEYETGRRVERTSSVPWLNSTGRWLKTL